LLRLLTNGTYRNEQPVTVREIMVTDPVTITPLTSSLEAIELMRKNGVGCLPVVEGDQLVGIVTSYDFLEASARLFKEHLKEPIQEVRRVRAQGA
jgi:CBS domain-containing protein